MKKVLSLGLAAAMMTSTAFAAQLSSKNIVPGTEVKFNYMDFVDTNKLYVSGNDSEGKQTNNILPSNYKISTVATGGTEVGYYNTLGALGKAWAPTYGAAKVARNLMANFGLQISGVEVDNIQKEQSALEKAKIEIQKLARQDIKSYDFTAQNFRATLKAAKGQNLVKSVTFDGTGNLVVTFKDDYRLPSTNGAPDFVVTELSVTSTRDIKDPAGTTTVLYRNRKFVADVTTAGGGAFNNTGEPVTVGVEAQDVMLYGTNEEILTGDGTWYKYVNGDAYRANVKYDDNSLTVTGTVYSGDVTSFKLGAELPQPVINVLQNNPNAKIDVYPIIAKGFKTGFTVAIKPTLVAGAAADANGNVEVLAALAANNKKIYTVSNTGVVTPAAFTYNAMTGNWEGRIPATGATLLVSDVALLGVTAAAPGTTITNPGTGLGLDLAAAIVK